MTNVAVKFISFFQGREDFLRGVLLYKGRINLS